METNERGEDAEGQPGSAPAAPPRPGRPYMRWLCLDCLRGPPEARRVPFGSGPAPPLWPALSARLLAPADVLVARCTCTQLCLRLRGPGACETVCGTSRVNDYPDGEGGEDCSANSEKSTTSDGESGRRYSEARCRQSCQATFVLASALLLSLCYYFQLFAATTDSGEPTPLSCPSYFTRYKTAGIGSLGCGLGAMDCRPINEWTPVRCNGWCRTRHDDKKAVPVIGSGPYRADSRICTAAVHAGLITDSGGCLEVRIGGPAGAFQGSTSGGIASLAFDSWFPLTLEMRRARGSLYCSYGAWWAFLLLNVALLFVLSLLRPPRQVFFWCLLTSLYWYCALVSSMNAVSMHDVMEQIGSFALFALVAHALLWELGGAKTYFPDTENGVPLDVLLLEILPALPLLHIDLVAFVTGDYTLTSDLFQGWRGPLVFMGGALILLPFVAVLLRRWYLAGALRQLVCGCLSVATAGLLLSLLFSTKDWGLHLHHYFMGLVGYLGARGNSRAAAFVRAISLGALIHGLCRWGQPINLPIWSTDQARNAPISEARTDTADGSLGSVVLWTAAQALGVAQDGRRLVLLSWALWSDFNYDCSLRPAGNTSAEPTFTVEMNHVQAYHGRERSAVFALPSTEPPAAAGAADRRFYFRVSTPATGLRKRTAAASIVLAVRAEGPATDFVYYNSSSNPCVRTLLLQSQPSSVLAGYV